MQQQSNCNAFGGLDFVPYHLVITCACAPPNRNHLLCSLSFCGQNRRIRMREQAEQSETDFLLHPYICGLLDPSTRSTSPGPTLDTRTTLDFAHQAMPPSQAASTFLWYCPVSMCCLCALITSCWLCVWWEPICKRGRRKIGCRASLYRGGGGAGTSGGENIAGKFSPLSKVAKFPPTSKIFAPWDPELFSVRVPPVGGGGGSYQNFRVGGSPTPLPGQKTAGECCQLRHVQRCTSRNRVIDNISNRASTADCCSALSGTPSANKINMPTRGKGQRLCCL